MLYDTTCQRVTVPEACARTPANRTVVGGDCAARRHAKSGCHNWKQEPATPARDVMVAGVSQHYSLVVLLEPQVQKRK